MGLSSVVTLALGIGRTVINSCLTTGRDWTKCQDVAGFRDSKGYMCVDPDTGAKNSYTAYPDMCATAADRADPNGQDATSACCACCGGYEPEEPGPLGPRCAEPKTDVVENFQVRARRADKYDAVRNAYLSLNYRWWIWSDADARENECS